MNEVLCIFPVLNRPHRVEPLLASLNESKRTHRLYPLFVVSRDDRDELKAVKQSGADFLLTSWRAGHGDFAMKINYAISKTDHEWVLAGADDLFFQPAWADTAIGISTATGKRFVGTNDRANPLVMRGRHATHPLVHRSYIELGTIDEPGKLYCEQYSHQMVDVEATATAFHRNEFVFAQYSIVEHHHPIFPRHGVRVAMDDTYKKGQRDGAADRDLFRQREHLWAGSVLRAARQGTAR